MSQVTVLQGFAVREQGDKRLSSYNTGLGVTVAQGWEGCSERAWVEHLVQSQSPREGFLVYATVAVVLPIRYTSIFGI